MRRVLSSKPKSDLSRCIKVGVLLGGTSRERPISLRSGKAVNRALKQSGFQTLLLDPRNQKKFQERIAKIDLAFIALHGGEGEDGRMQAFLAKKKIPYIGSDPKGCRRAFDKVRSKRIFNREGIPTPAFTVLKRSVSLRRLEKLKGAYFIKPPEEGSSIGAFSVEDLSKSVVKLRKQLNRYKTLLAEELIRGREYTVGIIGQRPLPVIELRPKRAFYDYKAKYTKGMTRYLLPAPIPGSLEKRLQRIALKTHRILGLRDLSRVDFMVDQKGNPFVLEANTIPGFTALSLLPKAAASSGMNFNELCTHLVQLAWKRR